MSGRNKYDQVSEEEIRLYLSDNLSVKRRKEVRRWFATEKGQERLSRMLEEDIVRILSGDRLQSEEPVRMKPLVLPDVRWKPQRRPMVWMRRAAVWISIIFSIAAGSYLYYDHSVKSVLSDMYVPNGDIQTFVFQDGTRVTVNADSRLKFASGFGLFRREVELEGEAYFEVAKDKFRPFIVHTHGLNVRVLGTKFNIKAYSEDEAIVTTLTEGKVRLTGKNGEQMVMLPGEEVMYSKTSGNLCKNPDARVEDHLMWKTGGLSFTDVRLRDISKDLSRKFGKKFSIEDEELGDTFFTIAFRDTSLQSMLDDLTRIAPIRFSIRQDTVVIFRK